MRGVAFDQEPGVNRYSRNILLFSPTGETKDFPTIADKKITNLPRRGGIMKISSTKPPENEGPDRGALNVRKAAAAGQKDRDGPVKKADLAGSVDIFDRSREIADIVSAVNQLPEVRDAKVREIKKSIDAGTYVVDSRKIAEKMLKGL
jgi:negative regulator of flagellin synthesis FlgM